MHGYRNCVWSRVMDATDIHGGICEPANLQREFMNRDTLKVKGVGPGRRGNPFLFDPDSLTAEVKSRSKEWYELDRDQKIEYGKIATQLRQQFQESAMALLTAGASTTVARHDARVKLAKTLARKYNRVQRETLEPGETADAVEVRVPSRRKRLRLSQVSSATLQEVLEDLHDGCYRLEDLCVKHQVTRNLVR